MSERCLKIPPDGGKVRQPWLALGMSRATWYRHGKPSEKPPKRETQAGMAKRLGISVRTIQRAQAAYVARVVARARAYVAKGCSAEEAIRLAKADEAQSD